MNKVICIVQSSNSIREICQEKDYVSKVAMELGPIRNLLFSWPRQISIVPPHYALYDLTSDAEDDCKHDSDGIYDCWVGPPDVPFPE